MTSTLEPFDSGIRLMIRVKKGDISGFFLTIAIVCGLVSVCVAQTENASISGRVTDPTGAVVPGAAVLLKSVEQGTLAQTVTNEAGIYVFSSVHPGRYHLSVKKERFKTEDYVGLVVNVQDHLEHNFQLTVGAASESITVPADVATINTENAAVSTVVDQRFVANMPLNGRSFQDLILLAPGVVTNPPQVMPGAAQQAGFSVNGQRLDANYYTVDGVSANVSSSSASATAQGASTSGSLGAITGAGLGTTQALVSADALEEFRVQSSSYSAEYGRSPGGQFSFTTKSGTNQWHGTGFDYLRNNFFDAHDWFNNYYGWPQLPLRHNDFGGTLGGPVRIPHIYNGKNKTFFFVSNEELRAIQPEAPAQVNVPDLCVRGLAPSSGPGACPVGVTPTTNSALQAILRAFPYPNFQADTTTQLGMGIAVLGFTLPSHINSTSVRLDQNLLDGRVGLFFRFSNTSSNVTANYFGAGVHEPNLTRTFTGGATYIFSSRLTNEFRVNYSLSSAQLLLLGGEYAVTDTAQSSRGVGGTSEPIQPSLIAALGLSSLSPTAYPNVFLFDTALSVHMYDSFAYNQEQQWNVVNTVNYAVGAHRLKFGLDYRRIPGTIVPGSNVVYNLTALPAIESGVIQVPSSSAQPIARASQYPVYTNFSAFAQDTWKATHRLTFDYGLRWELNPAPGVWQGHKPFTITGTSRTNYTLAPAGTPLWQTTWFNFAPRLGAAYVARNTQGWETVVRAGGGVFFDTGQQLGAISFNGPGFASDPIPMFLNGSQFPGAVAAQFPTVTYPPVLSPMSVLYGFYPHLQLPYTLQWNVSMQQALGKSQSFTASYVGAHGNRLLQENEYANPRNPTSPVPVNPNGNSFFLVESRGTSDYDALQLQFQRRLAHGLTGLASYTWSRCIDEGSSNFSIGYQRGDCDFDLRQNFTSAISYNLPNVGANKFAKALLHNWGVDNYFLARTALPVPLLGGNQLDPATGQFEPGAFDLVLNQPVYLYGSNCASVLQGLGELGAGQGCPGGRALNPCAFNSLGSSLPPVPLGPVNPGCGTPSASQLGGLAPRNFLRGFGAWQLNMAVRHDFPIHERLKLQFRAEAFNLFNHPLFAPFSTNAQTFGLVTQTLGTAAGSAGGGLATNYQFGGPRSMQFSLKLIF
jgi:hypothetical protein